MTRNPIDDGQTVIRHLFSSLMNAHGSEAVLNGIAPSVGTGDWDVDTTAGDVFINNTTAAVSSATTTLTDPAGDADLDSGEFRVDLLTADTGGNINVAEGVAASQPVTEDVPADEAVIACVVVSGDASSLTSSDIRDYRTLLESDTDRYVDGGPHEIDAAEFAGGQGSSGDFLQSDGSALSYSEIPFTSVGVNKSGSVSNQGPNDSGNIPVDESFYDGTGHYIEISLTNTGSDNGTIEARVDYSDGSTDTVLSISGSDVDQTNSIGSRAITKDGVTCTGVEIQWDAPTGSGNAFTWEVVFTVHE